MFNPNQEAIYYGQHNKQEEQVETQTVQSLWDRQFNHPKDARIINRGASPIPILAIFYDLPFSFLEQKADHMMKAIEKAT